MRIDLYHPFTFISKIDLIVTPKQAIEGKIIEGGRAPQSLLLGKTP
jgi:hypothetical protein